MKCRSCSAEIAANALICYKCGTATAEPRITPPSARPRRSRVSVVAIVLLGLALAEAARQVACGSLL
jgi:hypothetical protein